VIEKRQEMNKAKEEKKKREQETVALISGGNRNIYRVESHDLKSDFASELALGRPKSVEHKIENRLCPSSNLSGELVKRVQKKRYEKILIKKEEAKKTQDEEEDEEKGIPTRRGRLSRVKTIQTLLTERMEIEERVGKKKREYTRSQRISHCLKGCMAATDIIIVKKILMALLVLYNVVFIPLQFAFRIQYNSIFILMEIIILLFYTFDLIYHIKQLKKIKYHNSHIQYL